MSKRTDYDIPGGAQPAPEKNTGQQGWVPDEDPLVELARIVGESATRYRPSSRLDDGTPDSILPPPPTSTPAETPNSDPFAALDAAFRNLGTPAEQEVTPEEQAAQSSDERVDAPSPLRVSESPRATSPYVPPVETGEPFDPERFVANEPFVAPPAPNDSAPEVYASPAPSVELPTHREAQLEVAEASSADPRSGDTFYEYGVDEQPQSPSSTHDFSASSASSQPSPAKPAEVEGPVSAAASASSTTYAAFEPEVFPESEVSPEMPAEPNFGEPEEPVAPALVGDAAARPNEPNFDFEAELSRDLESSLAASLGGEKSSDVAEPVIEPPLPEQPSVSAPNAAAPTVAAHVPVTTAPGAGVAASSNEVTGAYELGSGIEPTRPQAVDLRSSLDETHQHPGELDTPAPSSGFTPDFGQFELDTKGEDETAVSPIPLEPASVRAAPEVPEFEADLLAELNARHVYDTGNNAPEVSVEQSASEEQSAPDPLASFEDELIASMDRSAIERPLADAQDDELFAPPGYSAAQMKKDEEDIDEMTWPAAAEHISNSEYDDNEDQTPPPQGYDLDAVAQAMRAEDPSLNGEGILPAVAPAAATQSAYDEEEEALRKSGGLKRGLLAAASIGGVLILGGAGYFVLGLGGEVADSTPPRIILAENTPMKEFPDPAEQPSDKNQAQILLPNSSQEAPEGERMLPRDTARVDPLPPAPDAEAEENNALIVNTPKRVRTVVVRPDGTIVSADSLSENAQQDSTRLLSQQQTASLGTIGSDASGSGNQPTVGAFSGTTQAQSSSLGIRSTSQEPATPAPSNPFDVSAQNGDEEVTEVAPEAIVEATPRIKPEVPATQVASASFSGNTSGPLVLSPTAAPPAPAAAAPSVGGSIPAGAYIVQVSSVRTQQEANGEIRSLRNRFPSLMSGVNPVVVRADLGDKGIFYRVRIPFDGQGSANQFCTDLKNAGGDCFVRRN
ncbi:SPOR domain-containing protein [Pseudovibrio exalbescens]|uniref:SPOR domain-containing protein n=1 Tax=Pseudovibrio exalbescens TaxID=197461 RepID=UPI002366B10F|nr:SPOR domain-containing protein [Pseudovibrio exalbescens]MDD7908739.1 SPOR domain-containing protein [Pseudovibrio exalbescens]